MLKLWEVRFQLVTEGQPIADTLYPNPQLVDCTLIATL